MCAGARKRSLVSALTTAYRIALRILPRTQLQLADVVTLADVPGTTCASNFELAVPSWRASRGDLATAAGELPLITLRAARLIRRASSVVLRAMYGETSPTAVTRSRTSILTWPSRCSEAVVEDDGCGQSRAPNVHSSPILCLCIRLESVIVLGVLVHMPRRAPLVSAGLELGPRRTYRQCALQQHPRRDVEARPRRGGRSRGAPLRRFAFYWSPNRFCGMPAALKM